MSLLSIVGFQIIKYQVEHIWNTKQDFKKVLCENCKSSLPCVACCSHQISFRLFPADDIQILPFANQSFCPTQMWAGVCKLPLPCMLLRMHILQPLMCLRHASVYL